MNDTISLEQQDSSLSLGEWLENRVFGSMNVGLQGVLRRELSYEWNSPVRECLRNLSSGSCNGETRFRFRRGEYFTEYDPGCNFWYRVVEGEEEELLVSFWG